MKKITLLLIILIAIQNNSFAQCELLNISINSQADVNNFAINYPGCTTINSLGITATEISNLNGLSQLTTIIENLIIVASENSDPELPDYPLSNISGLNNITTVGGGIYLSNFPNLTTTNIFNGLTQAGFISISQLTPLTITGFNNLLSTGEIGISNTNASFVSGFGFLNICENLIFTLNPNLQSVGGFANLYQVNNYLNIGQNPMLLSLPSLPQLTNVLGDFALGGSPLIENMEGVENLESVGRLLIIGNDGLTTLHGLENLGTVGTEVHISSNPNLTNCAINYICEEIAVPSGISFLISNNDLGCNSPQNVGDNCNLDILDIVLNSQEQVDNFSAMYPGGSAVGSLRIEGNGIANLDGLSQLTIINGDLTIASALNFQQQSSNYPLTDISGLNNITTVEGMVEISDVPNLTTANVFNALENAGAISISGLAPNTISGFNNLVATGLIAIQGTTITSFSGLGSLSICSDLIINNNQNLETISGLVTLNQITNDLKVEQNPMLQNLQGMENLQTIKGLLINSNTGLTSFNGLENLESVGTKIQINGNTMLNDLTALSNIVEFYGNTSNITIQDNALLSNLSGLQNVAPLTIDTVTIQNNPNLSNCAITNFCEKIDTGGGGQFTVANNASGCNNVSEIEAVCELGVTENAGQYFVLFPNPANTILKIQTDVQINSLKITDISGRTINVNDFDNNIINVSNLATGVYFIAVSSIRGLMRGTFIKN